MNYIDLALEVEKFISSQGLTHSDSIDDLLQALNNTQEGEE